MRGAIATGDCILDLERHILIGYPIAQAVAVEKRQEWLGIAVLPDAAKALEKVAGIVRYDVPVKDSSAAHFLQRAVAWHWAAENPGDAAIYLKRLSGLAREGDRAKYENAERFLRSAERE